MKHFRHVRKPDSWHHEASLKSTEAIIIRINGDSLKTSDDFGEKILNGPEELRFQVAGRPEPIVIHVARDGDSGTTPASLWSTTWTPISMSSAAR